MMFATDWEALGLAREPFVGGVTLSGVHDLKPLVHGVDEHRPAPHQRRGGAACRRSITPACRRRPCWSRSAARETSEFLRQSQLMWDAWPDNAPPAAGPLIVAGKHHFGVVVDFADPESELTRATLALFV